VFKFLNKIFKSDKEEKIENIVDNRNKNLKHFHNYEDYAKKLNAMSIQDAANNVINNVFVRKASDDLVVTSEHAMDSKQYRQELTSACDSIETGCGDGGVSALQFSSISSPTLIAWYTSQGFIGWQLLAMLAQHWLINKACEMPARDAIRKGFDISVNDGTDVDPKIIDEIKKLDRKFNLNKNCVEFVKMGRVFGIRVAMFKVESSDPEYYTKPFNIDGVTAGSYKGICQIDPYWITPLLDMESASNPASMHFYEPTWWQINGVRVHRTHLVIMKTSEVADILKPIYFYGGVSIPQKIYERVYAAERTANEAPQLAMCKRTRVVKTDIASALANQNEFQRRIQLAQAFQDNYSERFIDYNDEFSQLDTSLADFDAVMMSQYQIVAAAANVPAVKLLGTTPKGFNATGEYEEASYHEELESIQTSDLTPLIERHHMLLIKSVICPKFNVPYFTTEVCWNTLDSITATESALLNKTKAETAQILINSGALSPNDERERLIKEKDSGYNGMKIEEENLEIDDKSYTDLINSINVPADINNGEQEKIG